MELLGSAVDLETLVREVCKDRSYYETSGGGVTASGGEPLMQAGFVAEFLARLKGQGISTALDTCGLASRAALEKVLPHVDLVLFDLKEIDVDKHRAFTGRGNDGIFEALRFIGEYLTARAFETPSRRPRLWIRTPLIPGATATRENLLGLGRYIARHLDGLVERWELCAFNNLCRDKYRRLGIAWQYEQTPLLTAEELRAFETWAEDSGIGPGIVMATGATKDAQAHTVAPRLS